MDAIVADVGPLNARPVEQHEGRRRGPDRLFDDRPRKQDPAVVPQRQAGRDQTPPHLRSADLEAMLGEDALRLVDDAADQLGLENVQAGSHRRSIMPDRWWRPAASRRCRLREADRRGDLAAPVVHEV